MRNDYYSNSKDYINRWVVSYADFVTMLLALFMVMYAVSSNVTKYQANAAENLGTPNAQKAYEQKEKVLETLEKTFGDNISQSNLIKLVKEPRGLIVRLNDSMLFDEGSAIIKPSAQKTLDEIVRVLAKTDNPCIVEGHTDSTPISTTQYPSNWELSTARATNIITYMLKSKEISPKRLSAVGYGEYAPVSDNTSISGRRNNRRVDIIILNNGNNKIGE